MCSYRERMIDPLDPSTLEPARKEAGLTRAELAILANVDATTIMRIEKGAVDPRLDGTWRPLVEAVKAAMPRRRRKAA